MLRTLVARRCSPALAVAAAGLVGIAQGPAAAAGSCSVRSAHAVVTVVELYTSEGCSSCPPADRWLSTLRRDPGVVALAFHVDYWDRLGWKDRFASAAFTQRQASQQASNGARFSYTPQVVVDGKDRKDWPGSAFLGGPRPAAPVDVVLARDGDRVGATITASPRSPKRLAAYWAVTEHDHVSAVKAGENQGATLGHDFVVRDFRAIPAWVPSTAAPHALALQLATPADAAHRREVNLVVVDADTGRPVQAVKIGC